MGLTGLTEAIVNEDCTFEHFLWTCVSHLALWDDLYGMGVVDLGHQRLHERVGHYRKMLDDTISEKTKLESMTQEQFEVWWQARVEEDRAECEEAEARRKLIMKKMSAMHQKVEAWEPPPTDNPKVAKEHTRLKGVMLNQLTLVLKHNTKPYTPMRTAKAPDLSDKLRKANDLVELYRKKAQESEQLLQVQTEAVALLQQAAPIPSTMKVRE